MKEKFIEFLKKHRAWRKFQKGIKKEGITLDYLVTYYKDIPNNILYGAFSWNATPERHDYWSELSDKWRKECEN